MSDSTRARVVIVRRRTRGARRSITDSRSLSSGQKKATTDPPVKPKVTVGPRAYKSFKNGRRVVIRFWIAERFGNFYVVDSLTWRIADGTQAYREKKKAVNVAREYRDEYGAYCKSPF